MSVALLAACGQAGSPAAGPTPESATAVTASVGPGVIVSAPSGGRPAPPPTLTPSGGVVTVTPDQYDATVRLAVGDRLVVDLGEQYWSDPVTSNPAVLERRQVTRTDHGATRAELVASAAGRADVTAGTHPPCLDATPPCMVAQRGLVVHVVVQ